MRTLAPPLDVVSADARIYPTHLLPWGGTGLCLFAAAFLGVNDAVHMARMAMTGTLVDVDRDRLFEMGRLYGGLGFTVVPQDAWEFAEQHRSVGAQWDVVSVDTFTGDAELRSLESLELWTSLARDVVTVTQAKHRPPAIPDGWESALMARAPGIQWLVLTRC